MPLLQGTVLYGGTNPLDHQPYDLEGNCGYFARNVEWTVDQSEPREGIIFQLVRRIVAVERFRILRLMFGQTHVRDIPMWRMMSPGQVDMYVADSPQLALYPMYWEAWKVPRGSVHPTYSGGRYGQADDCFSLTSIISALGAPDDFHHTTRGRYTMRGAAFFMQTTADPVTDFGFSAAGNTPAGALPFHAATNAMLLPNMRIDSDILRHEVIVDWDSATLDQDGTYGVSQVADTLVNMGPYDRDDLSPFVG
jgi:hypothetical protein